MSRASKNRDWANENGTIFLCNFGITWCWFLGVPWGSFFLTNIFFWRIFLKNFFDELFWRIVLTIFLTNLEEFLTIASFRIGVPTILLRIITKKNQTSRVSSDYKGNAWYGNSLANLSNAKNMQPLAMWELDQSPYEDEFEFLMQLFFKNKKRLKNVQKL